jgi:hypothetical protein
MQAKYADVVPLEAALSYLDELSRGCLARVQPRART